MYGAKIDVVARPLMDKWSAPRKVRFTTSPLGWARCHWTNARLGSKLMRFFTCVDESAFEEFAADSEVRDQVKTCMTEHTRGHSVEVVANVIKDVRREQSYELSDATDFLHKRLTFVDWEIAMEKNGLSPEEALALRDQSMRVIMIPRFAAAAIVALRSKFGVMGASEANVLLIQREYLRICREAHVRACDTELHRQFVMNGYFSEDVLSHLATVRTRIPAWMRTAFGPSAVAVPQVC